MIIKSIGKPDKTRSNKSDPKVPPVRHQHGWRNGSVPAPVSPGTSGHFSEGNAWGRGTG